MKESKQTSLSEIPFLLLLPYACEPRSGSKEIGASLLRNGLPAGGNPSEQPQLVGEAQRNGRRMHPHARRVRMDCCTSSGHALPSRQASAPPGAGPAGNF